MIRNNTKKQSEQALKRIAEIHEEILTVDFACTGTLHRRTKTCGRPTCLCHSDPDKRHGPYIEWSRREQGRLVHRNVSPDVAEFLDRAIENRRKLEGLLRQWDNETLLLVNAVIKKEKKR